MVTTRRGLDTESQESTPVQEKATQKRALRDTAESTRSKRRKNSNETESSLLPFQNTILGEPDGKSSLNYSAQEANAGNEASSSTPRASQRTERASKRKEASPLKETQSSQLQSDECTKDDGGGDTGGAFDGDVIKVDPSTAGSMEQSGDETTLPEVSFYGTPDTRKAESIYATPATHSKGSNFQSRRLSSPAQSASTRLATKTRSKLSLDVVVGKTEQPSQSTPKASARPKLIPIRTISSQDDQKDSKDDTECTLPEVQDSQESHNAEDVENTEQHPPAKTKHIRFGSEESVSVPVTTSLVPEQLEEEDDDESDSGDEAPETVSKDAAATQLAKELDAAAARSAKHDAIALEKQRKKENRLKEHVEARRIKQAKREEKATIANLDLNNLPALLPEELLAAAPAERPQSPLLPSMVLFSQQTKKKQHLKFLDASEKEPKDKKVGLDKVRVLKDRSQLLAPKANMRSKSIREKWLHDRTDNHLKKGYRSGNMERKEAYRGFLRR